MQLHSNNSGNIRPIDNGYELVHDDPRTADLFSEFGTVIKEPLFDKDGTPYGGGFALKFCNGSTAR